MLAYVLSGGGSRGAVQAGAVVAAMEAGLVPDVVVGTSVGALNAAFLAWRPDHRRALELAQLWRQVAARPIFPRSRWARIANMVRYGDRLYSPHGLRELVRQLPYRRIEDAGVSGRRCHRAGHGNGALVHRGPLGAGAAREHGDSRSAASGRDRRPPLHRRRGHG